MNIFSFVKSHLSIIDIIKEYISLKKAGAYFKASCPFHHEKTGSFTVSPHKEIFYCFGCHTSGDAISFVARMENISQKEAVTLLCERYNIQLPPESVESNAHTMHAAKKYYALCSLFADWCHKSLLKSPSILTYCYDRGFTNETLKLFTIGYFPGGLATIKRFTHYAKQHNILLEDICEAHIFIQGKNSIYSPFEQRIIFPITDHMGRTCGFGGRVFKQEDTRSKYYNSKEHALFAKGSLLFGLDQAKKSIQHHDCVFLVEGYTDCLSMAQHGYPHTVATLGTACSLAHLKLLSRYTRSLYVIYDSDAAGMQAILRIAQLCWQVDIELKVVTLPPHYDPASYLFKYGTLDQEIQKAQDIYLYYLATLDESFSNAPFHIRINHIRSFLSIIRGLEDPLKQTMLLTQASECFHMPFQTLKDELDRLATPSARSQPQKLHEIPEKAPHAQLSELEKKFFSAIVNNMQLFNMKDTSYIIGQMSNPAQTILNKLYHRYSISETHEPHVILDCLHEDEKEWTIRHMFEHDIDKATFESITQQLMRTLWKHIVLKLKQEISYAKRDNNAQKVYQLMQDFLELKKKMLER